MISLKRIAMYAYPRAWRKRYGSEFAVFMDDVDPQWSDALDILRSAAGVRMKRFLAGRLREIGRPASTLRRRFGIQ